jgi:hypothetical protein
MNVQGTDDLCRISLAIRSILAHSRTVLSLEEDNMLQFPQSTVTTINATHESGYCRDESLYGAVSLMMLVVAHPLDVVP